MERVGEIAKSIAEVGLMNPPGVCIRNDVTMPDGEICDGVGVLIYGRHRLLALKALGHEYAECDVYDVSDLQAELIEISENLHRAELKALERDVQIARWIELTTEKQVVSDKLSETREGRPGVPSSVADELGVDAKDAQRAVKVATLKPEARAAAVEAGLDDNRSALLKAAKETTADAQVAKLKQIAETKAKKRDPRQDAPSPLDVDEAARRIVDKWGKDFALEFASRLEKLEAAGGTMDDLCAALRWKMENPNASWRQYHSRRDPLAKLVAAYRALSDADKCWVRDALDEVDNDDVPTFLASTVLEAA